MNKPTKKKNKYTTEIINRLVSKYGVSKRFIQMSLGDERESETSSTIKKDYSKMYTAVINLLNKM